MTQKTPKEHIGYHIKGNCGKSKIIKQTPKEQTENNSQVRNIDTKTPKEQKPTIEAERFDGIWYISVNNYNKMLQAQQKELGEIYLEQMKEQKRQHEAEIKSLKQLNDANEATIGFMKDKHEAELKEQREKIREILSRDIIGKTKESEQILKDYRNAILKGNGTPQVYLYLL